jgi:group I intron endonuclease
MSSGVYQIINTVDGKVYVGSAMYLPQREASHRYYLRKGNHHCVHLQRAWNRDGEDAFAFEVLEEVSDPERLIEREQYWMDAFDVVKTGYNITPVAGSVLGFRHTTETKAKIGAASKARQCSPEAKAVASARQKRIEKNKAKLRAGALVRNQ